MKKSIFSLLIAVFVSIFSFSQIENPFDKVAWNFSVEREACEATIIATITMQEHWHISPNKLPATSFAIPTDFILEKSVMTTMIIKQLLLEIKLKSSLKPLLPLLLKI